MSTINFGSSSNREFYINLGSERLRYSLGKKVLRLDLTRVKF